MPNPVLEHPPLRFDHAIGEYDVDLGYDPLDRPASNECIHLRIEVLDPAVHVCLGDQALQSLGGFDQQLGGRAGVIGYVGLTSQDAPGIVIDHGVHVNFGSPYQLNQRRAHMPDLIGFSGSNSHSWFR